MDKEFLEKIEQKLLEEKARLEKDLGKFAHKDPQGSGNYDADFPNYGDDEDENASEVGTFTTNISLEKILESSLRDVTNALKRIEEKSYGICKYCQKEIDQERLLVRPASSACITCKQELTKEK